MDLCQALAAALLGLAALLPVAPAGAEEAADPGDMVNAINGLYDSHKGYRAVDATGYCGAVALTAVPEAAANTKSTLLDKHAVPVMFRFSLAPGVPQASDTEQAPPRWRRAWRTRTASPWI